MLPPFVAAGRTRPVSLLRADAGATLEGAVAPYVGVAAELAGTQPVALSLVSGETELCGTFADGGLGLEITSGGQTTRHRSRRHGRPDEPPTAVALTLTGVHVGVWSQRAGAWTLRGRVDLTTDLPHPIDPRDDGWLGDLRATQTGAVEDLRAGVFGQLGLRDLRLVTHADGAAYRLDDAPDTVFLTATSAGPGFFDTAHTSVWALSTTALELTHRADLFFRRPDRPGVFGDHATHLVRDAGRWLVATSTWGDFDRTRKGAGVAVTIARTDADVLHGGHVLDTEPLALPTGDLTSVGVWDPHLARTDDGWLVAYVSARRFFSFHPVLASGPDLDQLSLRGAATDRRATEGPTLARVEDRWRLLASDGRDNRRGRRARYPVFDLDLHEIATLDAPYPTNIPWPTLVETGDGWLMVGFNGRRYGGPLVGYGSHGDVVFARTAPPG